MQDRSTVVDTPYGGVTLELPASIVFDGDLQPSDVRVYLTLSWFARGGLDRPTQAGIAQLAQLNRGTVATSLRRLVAAGLVSVDLSASPHAYTIAA